MSRLRNQPISNRDEVTHLRAVVKNIAKRHEEWRAMKGYSESAPNSVEALDDIGVLTREGLERSFERTNTVPNSVTIVKCHECGTLFENATFLMKHLEDTLHEQF